MKRLGGHEGILYFPEADVEIHGESIGQFATESDCSILIADTFHFRGQPECGLRQEGHELVPAGRNRRGEIL